MAVAVLGPMVLGGCGGGATTATPTLLPSPSATWVVPGGASASPGGSASGGPDATETPMTAPPTPSTWVAGSEGPGMPGDLPGQDIPGGPDAPGLPSAVEAGNLGRLSFPGAGEFTAAQTRSAFEFAAAFAAARYSSGLWADGAEAAAGSPVFYYQYSAYLTPATYRKFEQMVISPDAVRQNQAALDLLAPPAPPIGDGIWMQPAVANWEFGQPVFTGQGQQLTVAFEMAGAAVYRAANKSYWAFTVRDKVALGLQRQGSGWRVATWDSVRSFEPAVQLDYVPVGRHLPEQLPVAPSADGSAGTP